MEVQLPYSSHSSCTSRCREVDASFMAKMGEPGTSPWTCEPASHESTRGMQKLLAREVMCGELLQPESSKVTGVGIWMSVQCSAAKLGIGIA